MIKDYSEENQKLNTENILNFGKDIPFKEIPESSILNLNSDYKDCIVDMYIKFTYNQQFFNFFPRINKKDIESRVESLGKLLEEAGLELGKTVNNRQGKVNNNEIIDYTKPELSTAVSQRSSLEDGDSSSDDDNCNEITTHRSTLTNRYENKNNNSSKVIKKGNPYEETKKGNYL